MSFTITNAHVAQYRANVRMLGEQERSVLEPICEKIDVVGKTFYGENLSGSEAVIRTSRHSDNPFTPVTHGRRKGTIVDYEWGDYVDPQDTEKVLVEFRGKYVQLGIQAHNRKQDDIIISALGSAVYCGEEGGTTVQNYDVGECRIIDGAGNLVAAGSDASDTTQTALTIAKLGLCGELLDEAQLPEGLTRYFIANAYNKWQLLQTTEVSSADYNTVKALAHGDIDTFMGFKFLWTQRLLTHGTDTGCIRAYACVQNAIALGVAQETQGDMWQDTAKTKSWYCYVKSGKGAVRQEGPAVIEILLKSAA